VLWKVDSALVNKAVKIINLFKGGWLAVSLLTKVKNEALCFPLKDNQACV